MKSESNQLTAFVVMPIRKPGTQDHTHFRAIYDEYIKPRLEAHGYLVARADDIQKSGAISKDIVLRLASADLVVADLTDLNANVFYELGIRHALRSRGTIMILDEDRTPEIPFDLAAYRVHKYGTSSIAAIGPLSRGLEASLQVVHESDETKKIPENPVHDWLPTLPSNVVQSTGESTEGSLRKQLAAARSQLHKYEERFGNLSPETPEGYSHKIRVLLDKAKEGRLPVDLLSTALQAAQSNDRVGFLEAVFELSEDSTSLLDVTDYIRLLSGGDVLGLTQLRHVVMEMARDRHPNDMRLLHLQLQQLAHSHLLAERTLARERLAELQGLAKDSEDRWSLGPNYSYQPPLLGVMLDAFHADNLDNEALSICETIIEKNPSDDTIIRSYARALEKVGSVSVEVVLEWQRKAVLVPGSNDVSARWLGNSLHNNRRNRDAVEAFALACLRDPADASNWCQLADEVCIVIGEQGISLVSSEDEPGWVTDILPLMLFSAYCCPDFSHADLILAQQAVKRVGMNSLIDEVAAQDFTPDPEFGFHGDLDLRLLKGRKAFAVQLYDMVSSSLTDGSDMPSVSVESNLAQRST
ncbi:MAG: hypothetical protein ACRCYU_19585 [Nocardioides sp.]